MNDLERILLRTVFIGSLLLSFQVTRAQPDADFADSIRNRFERHITNVHQEKVFLHLDRNSYITGETIWLSAYCVDAAFHTPAGLSRVLNVELLDLSGQPVKQIRIQLNDGHGSGHIFVSPDIKSGHYVVRAYTNWMKNFSHDFVFKKDIKIVNPSSVPDSLVAGSDTRPVIEFFPEGGHLVAGLNSKVAVKATDSFGKGIAVAGIVYDHQDSEVAEFTTAELGYTYFLLTPDPGKTYTARLEFDSVIYRYQLPMVMETGLILSVNTTESGDLNIEVDHTVDFREDLYLTVHTRGIINKLLPIELQQSKDIQIKAIELPAGISHITLLDRDFNPWCERLVFKYPDFTNIASLNLNSREYRKREQVRLSMELNKELNEDDLAHFSVSVFHSDGTDQDFDNIVSNLLLTSDLAGPIPDPWIFFNPENRAAARQLDLVMLTNGWRRFDWDEIKSDRMVELKYPAEINAPILSGQVQKNLPGNITRSLQLNFWGKVSVMNSVRLDPDGLFHIEVPFRVNSDEVLFFMNDDTLSSDQVSIFSPFDLEYTPTWKFTAFSPESSQYLELLNENIQVSQVYRGYNHINGLQTEDQHENTAFYGVPDHLYMLDNYTRFETIEDLFIEYIRSAVIRDNRRSSGFHVIYDGEVMPGKALTLIDGVPILDYEYVINFDPLKIEKIGVVNNIYRMGSIEYSGVLDFTTYQGDLDGQPMPEYIVEKVYHGLQSPRQFYSPDYSSNQNALARIPDFRSTLYWNPVIEMSAAKGAELEFYTSDDSGIYRIEINGVSNSGHPVFLQDSFEVK